MSFKVPDGQRPNVVRWGQAKHQAHRAPRERRERLERTNTRSSPILMAHHEGVNIREGTRFDGDQFRRGGGRSCSLAFCPHQRTLLATFPTLGIPSPLLTVYATGNCIRGGPEPIAEREVMTKATSSGVAQPSHRETQRRGKEARPLPQRLSVSRTAYPHDAPCGSETVDRLSGLSRLPIF